MTALFVPLEQLLYVYRSLHVNCELQISHANLELRFPRKKTRQQMVLPELDQVMCVFTSLIKYTTHLLC